MDSDVNEIRTSLRAAIKRDRNMFIKAKIDPMFDSVRPQVNALLEDMLQKTKVNAEKGISDVEFAVQKMKRWFSGGIYASSADIQKYDFIRNKISDAKDKIKTHSYFGYDDALKIISGTSKMVDEIQASIRSDLDSTESEFDRDANESNHIFDKINGLNKNKKLDYIKRIFIAYGLLLIVFISIEGHWLLSLVGGIAFFIALTIPFMYLWKMNIISAIIAAFIVDIIFLIVTFVTSETFGSALIVIFLLGWPFIPDRFIKSELSDLERQQTKLKEQNSTLERRITAAKKSLL